jgi:hypothetical protein
VIEIPLAIIAIVTGLPIGFMRLMVDCGAVLAVLTGIPKIVVATRRLRIRRRRAGPAAIWKEALRAEDEHDFEEAVRLYREIIRSCPFTTWAHDATWSIEFLRRKGKICLERGSHLRY